MTSASERTPEPIRVNWKGSRLIGGVAALLAAFVFRRWLSAEFGMLQSFGLIHFQMQGIPSTPLEWFALLHTNAFVGLLLLNFFDVVNYILAGLMYLGVYSLLRNRDKAYIGLAMVLTIVGISIYIASNQALNLLSLSNQFFASTSDVERPLILAAGEYALVVNDPVVLGTGVFWSYVLFYAAGLMLSIGMVKSDPSGKWKGVVGMVANAFGLGYFFTAFLGPSLSVIPAVGSALANLVWYIAVGIQLLRSTQEKA